ncbi:MAG: hypothetical protein PQJ61_03475 [Spirochaetales bacterium]|uniref:Uncharacterized protein n=1 Tax=Candidatus Thalassospirochaeta sargassi TaxID=3119039 RepID=A0AAJ1IAR4_9SPIO|nr:hypothetical protein [Spirochaetales bacterium]
MEKEKQELLKSNLLYYIDTHPILNEDGSRSKKVERRISDIMSLQYSAEHRDFSP